MNEELSKDARLASGMFSGPIGTNKLTFQRPHAIGERMRRGLEELAEKGYLEKRWTNHLRDSPLEFHRGERMRREGPLVSMRELREDPIPVLREDDGN